MLQELGWEDLQSRRDHNKATMMYRIVNNLVEIPAEQYLIATYGRSNKRISSTIPAKTLFYQRLKGILLPINSPTVKHRLRNLLLKSTTETIIDRRHGTQWGKLKAFYGLLGGFSYHN